MITYDQVVARVRDPKPDRDGTLFFCPCHPDGQKQGKRSAKTWPLADGIAGVKCFAGCNTRDILQALGFDLSNNGDRQEPEAVYDYWDIDRKLLYQVVRGQNKDFKQRRPDGNGGWIWNLQGVKPTLYRLPETIEAVQRGETVFVCEGEKDCNNLAKLGLAATTNSGGAGKWQDSFSDHLAGAVIVILPDNDDPGRRHADQVARSLQGKAKSIKVVELPGLPDKGDVSDWLAKGGTKEELLKMVAEALEWEVQAPAWMEPEPIQTTLRAVEKLPAGIIPEPFRDWLTDAANRMQCPLDFVAVASIIEAGAIIGAGCGIRPKQKDTWLTVPNLWGGVVASPSKMKSPALEETINPLERLEAEAKDDHDQAFDDWEADNEAYKAKREAIKGDMATAAKGKAKQGEKVPDMAEAKAEYAALEEPETPTWRRYKTSDSTIEKMAVLLKENPRGLLVFRDELVGLLVNWGREDRQADRAFYLEAWRGKGGYTTDRIGRGTIHTPNMCLSILGSMQPSKLTGYLLQANDDLQNDGLLQRFQLLVYPDELEDWKYIDKQPDFAAKDRAFKVFKTLAEMDFTQHGAELPEGERIPFLHFDYEAQELFKAWLTELEEKIEAEGTPLMSEHLGKYRSLMPSLALIIHLINVADGHPAGPVTEEAAAQAAAWCEYLESHARRIYGLLADISIRAAEVLAERIKKRELADGFSVRDVYHKGWHLLDKKEIVEQACEELAEAGWLRPAFEDKPGRQPKEVFMINPKIFSLK
jgi:hypothetical protein